MINPVISRINPILADCGHFSTEEHPKAAMTEDTCITLRDIVALSVLIKLLDEYNPDDAIKDSFEIADKFLVAREANP